MNFYSSYVLIKVMLCLAVIFTDLQKLRKCVMTERIMFTHWKLWPNHAVGTKVAATQAAAVAAQGGAPWWSVAGWRQCRCWQAAGRYWVLKNSWNQNVPFPKHSLSDFIIIKRRLWEYFSVFLKVKTDLKSVALKLNDLHI